MNEKYIAVNLGKRVERQEITRVKRSEKCMESLDKSIC